MARLPAGLPADMLALDDRILAVADVADALSAERPYRGALAPERVLEIMNEDRGTKLDHSAIDDALEAVLPVWVEAGRRGPHRHPHPR